MQRRRWSAMGALVLTVLAATLLARSLQRPVIRELPEASLREYAGPYRWDRDGFLYLQMWAELAGANQLVAFDETGELRTLYPTDPDRFFAGPGAAVPDSVESRIAVERDARGRIASLTWARGGAPARIARPVDIERREDIRFSNGDIQLAGALISPRTRDRIRQ